MARAGQKKRGKLTSSPAAAARPAVAAGRSNIAARWELILGVAVLVGATIVAYLPALHAGFVQWDDPEYVINNALLRDLPGLKAIWLPLASSLPQYYPLVFSSYWFEYHLWGLAPAGYHATNVALHVVNTGLVVALVRALGGSRWLALGTAALFALHPVQVESVAWVTERKATLSGLFYLLALLLYLRHRQTGAWAMYTATLAAFLLGLLSKTQTLTLPLVIAYSDWLLQRAGRLPRLRMPAVAWRVAPMLVLAAAAALITTAAERRVTQAWAQLPTPLERFFIAANAPWHYLQTFVAPLSLAPMYPKWHLSPWDIHSWLGVLAWGVVAAALVRWRPRLDTLPAWGVFQFLTPLIPVLGLVPFTYQHYSYVADRFLYLSTIGGAVVVVALAERLRGNLAWGRRGLAVTAAGVLVVALCGLRTYTETTHWRDNDTFWTHALERYPDSYPANINLARDAANRGQWVKALPFYRKAHELQPTDTYALTGYLGALQAAQGPHALITACTEEIGYARPNAYVAHFYRALAYERLNQTADALADYDRVLKSTRPGSGTWRRARQARDRLTRQ